MKTKLFIPLLILSALALALFAVQPAYAATITVNDLGDTAADDGVCTLREAITAANTDTASGAMAGECAAGAGDDTIIFSVAGTINLTGGELSLTSNVVISGDGHVIDAGGGSRVFSVTDGTSTIQNVTIQNGDAGAGFGGGVEVNGAAVDLTLDLVTITGNTAEFGGGVDVNTGQVTILNSTISGNTANFDGGGIEVGGVGMESAIIQNTAIISNTAGDDGGGLDMLQGTVDILNATISGNTGGNGPGNQGGGMRINGGTATFTYVTMTNNQNETGGGVAFNGGSLTVAKSIILGNDSVNSADEDCNNPPTDGGFNAPGDNCGFMTNVVNITVGDLGPLADNGGRSLTHALSAMSVGVNAIPTSDADCASGNGTIDQRGAERAGGGADGGAGCEPGAYEVSSESPTAVAMRQTGAESSTSVLAILTAVLLMSAATFVTLRKRATA